MKIRIPNFDHYNPRKDIKKMTWFRLEVDAFENEDFYDQPPIVRYMFIFLLMMCARKNNGCIDFELSFLLNKANMKKREFLNALEILESKRVIIVDRSEMNESVTGANENDKQTNKRTKQTPREDGEIFVGVINHLNAVTGSRLKANSSPHKKLIDYWVDKGYKLDDFKHVVDVKFQEWGDNPKMAKYTKRPATLFGKSHFEDYLSQELERNDEDVVFDYLSGLEQEMREKQGDRKNGNGQGGNKSASSATQ